MNIKTLRTLALAALLTPTSAMVAACSGADSPESPGPGTPDAGVFSEDPGTVDGVDGGREPNADAETDADDYVWGEMLGEPCTDDEECGADGVCVGPLIESEEYVCVIPDNPSNCENSIGIALDLDGSGREVEVCVPLDFCVDVDRDGTGVGPQCSAVDCDDYDERRSWEFADVCNGVDDNCDGVIDNGADVGVACETGLAGMCVGGDTVCNAGVLSCEPRIEPVQETCNGIDDDCDGMVDGTDTIPINETCYDGPAGTQGVGVCALGVRTCSAGAFGLCEGQVLPTEELCNALDDNCDGITDDIVETCYTGPEGTLDVGVCAEGARACTEGEWGVCMGEVTPGDEVCDGLDNDCDGVIDDGCPIDWVTPGETFDAQVLGVAGNPTVSGLWGSTSCPDDMFLSGLVVTSRPATPSGECASGTLDCLGSVQALCSRFEIRESRASVPYSYTLTRPFIQEGERRGSSLSAASYQTHRFECPDGEMIVALSGVAFSAPGQGSIDELAVECATPQMVAPDYDVVTDAVTTVETLFDTTLDSPRHESFTLRCEGGAAHGINVRSTLYTAISTPDASPVALELECVVPQARIR